MSRNYGRAAQNATRIAGTVLVLVAAVMGRAAFAQSMPVGVPLESAVAQAGREYYLRYCASCHGFQGRGDGAVAPALSAKPADLTTMAQRRRGEFPVDELGAIIDGRKMLTAHGTREMPVWGERFGRDFEGDPARDQAIRGQILMLLVYLQSIQR